VLRRAAPPAAIMHKLKPHLSDFGTDGAIEANTFAGAD
jgi:hypothetical protein